MSDEILLFPKTPRVEPYILGAVEAVLFASGEVMRFDQLAEALPEVDPAEVRKALPILMSRYEGEDRGLTLVEIAGGWQLRTDVRFADAVRRVVTAKPVKLSRASLEVLSVIAWEQPATKQDVDAVRGVDCGNLVRKLLEQGLIRVSGRRQIAGRPLEYRTTRAFLQLFSLDDLQSLPTLADAEELGDPG